MTATLPLVPTALQRSPVASPIEPIALRTSSAEGKVIFIRTRPKWLRADTVVISDIHLGSEVSRPKRLRKALQEWFPFRRLIILGDLFEDLNFSRLKKNHFGLIDDFRKLTAPKRGVIIDWIEGNHDEHGHDIIRRMIGANTHDELMLDYGKKSYLFLHGHQFDSFLYDHPILSKVAGEFYAAVQQREGSTPSISRWLKKQSKGWLKVCQKVEERAIDYGTSRAADYVFCGHTHYHDAVYTGPERRAKYVNTGCWTDKPSTLITLGEEGYRKHLYL